MFGSPVGSLSYQFPLHGDMAGRSCSSTDRGWALFPSSYTRVEMAKRRLRFTAPSDLLRAGGIKGVSTWLSPDLLDIAARERMSVTSNTDEKQE